MARDKQLLTITKTDDARKEPHRWKPGQSGNPRGSPRQYNGPTIAEYARMYTRDAVHALVIALKHPSTRVPAAIALLDRGWGKPDINVHTKNESTVLHLVAAQLSGDELLEAITKPPPQIEGQASDEAKE